MFLLHVGKDQENQMLATNIPNIMIKKSLKVHFLAFSDLSIASYNLRPWIEFFQLPTGYMATDTNDMLQVQLIDRVNFAAKRV